MTQNSDYDLYLGDISTLQGYRCRTLQRDSAPLVASKFSTGQAGQTDLDLLKSASLDNVAGGMFQRDHIDSQKAARAIGVFNRYDQNLYPTPPRSSATALSGGYYPIAKAESELTSFLALGAFSAGTYYNLLYMMTYGNGWQSVTLPAALQNNGFTNITGLVLHKQYLFVLSRSAVAGANCHRYDISAGTWQDVSWNFCYGAVLRGTLYLVGPDSAVCVISNETIAGAMTFTVVDFAGSSETKYIPQDMVEYNGALYIAKADGIYRFDGVKALRILPLATNQLKVFNGALYFASGLWLYKFDGTTVTRLQFFGNQEIIGSNGYPAQLGLSANSDFLFISTVVLTSGYTQADKFGVSASGLKRIYTYDGASFVMLHESSETVGSNYSALTIAVRGTLYDIFANISGSSWGSNRYTFDLSSLFNASAVTTNSKLEITTSEFDDGFPNIFKSLELIEPLYTGLIVGDALVVSYSWYDGKVWSAWQTAGTLTSTTGNNIEITDASKKLFKRLKINVTLTPAAGSTAQLKGVAWRYTLQPKPRWRWQALLMAEGNNAIQDRNGNSIATDANAISNNLIKTIKQKTPIFMLSPDYGKVKTTVNNAALSFIIKGQPAIYADPYNEYPLCAVKNNNGVWEVLRVSGVSYNSGTDETTITVLERGYWGVTAAQINADAEFHVAYKVYVTRLLRESPTLDVNTYNQQDTTGESQLQREFLLEITEV